MKRLSRKTHGFLDYIVGTFLVLAPGVFGFDGENGGRVFVFLGISTVLYSLITNYELGLFKILSFRVHLALDLLSGLFLAISPWVLRFSDRIWIPHVLFGIVNVSAVMMTRTASSSRSPSRIFARG